MKTQIIIFCFLAILLLMSSLNHLRLLNRCNLNNSELKEILLEKSRSNTSLNGKISEKKQRLDMLRKLSAQTIYSLRSRPLKYNVSLIK